MKRRTFLTAAITFSAFFGTSQQTVDTYIAGNSLVHHIVQVNPTPSQETSAPHWMQFLAEEAGNSFTISGNFMGLPMLLSQNQIPLENQWTFDSVPSGWDSWSTPFGQSSIDNVLFTPLNYVQYREPYENYEFGDTQNSPITAADTLIDWIIANKPGTPVYIYEGWPDMGTYTGGAFPPTQTEWATYQADAGFNGNFHEWFLELHDSLVERFPNECIKLIPVGPIISELLDEAPYNTIAIDTLYEDDAPHGRPSIYLLAGMITYMALYQEQAPLTYQPPSEFIDPTIIAEYPNLVNDIWAELQNFNFNDGNSRVFCDPTLSIHEQETFVNFKAYPNPADDFLHVKTDIVNGKVVLRNLVGHIVTSEELGNSIEVTSLPSGYYFLELQDRSHNVLAVEKVFIR